MLPLVSVIILSWNGRAYIESCLCSLLEQDYEALEVIVVDNASRDGTPELVAERFPSVKLIRNEGNTGYAVGNNLGLRAARGEIKILLNQDTEVEPGWLQAIVDAMDVDPRIGIVGCKIYFPGKDRQLQHAGGKAIFPHATVEHYSRKESDEGQQDTVQDVEVVTGAAMALRSEMLERIGLLDEGFFLYYEDTDLCFRARRASYRILYAPEARLTHVETGSGERNSERYYRRIHTSRWRFILKHYDPDDVLSESIGFDRTWLHYCNPKERRGIAFAYLATIANLPDILRAHEALHGTTVDREKREKLEGELYQLRLHTWQVPDPDRPELPEDRPLEEPLVLGELHRSWHVREHPFTSEVPYLGPLIARTREALNNVSTRWYILPLLQQQNVYNELMLQQVSYQVEWMKMQNRWLTAHERILDAYRRALLARDQEYTELLQRTEALKDQVTRLNRTVAAMEARLAELEQGEEASRVDLETKGEEDG